MHDSVIMTGLDWNSSLVPDTVPARAGWPGRLLLTDLVSQLGQLEHLGPTGPLPLCPYSLSMCPSRLGNWAPKGVPQEDKS